LFEFDLQLKNTVAKIIKKYFFILKIFKVLKFLSKIIYYYHFKKRITAKICMLINLSKKYQKSEILHFFQLLIRMENRWPVVASFVIEGSTTLQAINNVGSFF